MMTTPVWDFVRRYADGDALRAHMPGHKGRELLGFERFDITEFDGADSLFEPDGIIRESEKNAGEIFGAETFYSTEGSSLCVRAMLFLAVKHARENGKKPLVAAGRNAHSTFISAAALLDFDVVWIYPNTSESYLSCRVTPQKLERLFAAEGEKPTAVYLTTPDYLGNITEISSLAEICHRNGALLLVDNAHGAYLKFLHGTEHPIGQGADICCDSAHKTLPVLTGGAYLHISKNAPEPLRNNAKAAMSLFGSTSPSYIILASLDAANRYLSNGYGEKLSAFAEEVGALRKRLEKCGYAFCGEEPIKLTFDAKKYGYGGGELAGLLLKKNVFCEFSDPDYLVMMLTPENGEADLEKLEAALLSVERRPAIDVCPPELSKTERAMSPREAMFAPGETLPVEKCRGRVLASARVGCPPAVPIVVCGERIDSRAVECFEYYGISSCTVVQE